MSVGRFLESLGLGKYIAVFENEAVELETLRELDEADLQTLGLPLGHRKKILRAISSGSWPVTDSGTSAEPENRRVAVLFCDLVSSTPLTQSMNAEELRDLLANFQMACVEAIEEHDGHVAKYLGDGLMAYFGYPLAHEDDAVRAVGAALKMMQAIQLIKAPSGKPLQARIGIHTGRVIAGEMGAGRTREKLSVVGEAPIVASRLEQLAGSGEILISDAVQRLAGGYVSTESLGKNMLKGFERPIHVFRVRGLTIARSRFEANRGRSLGQIIGRDAELALLHSRWDRVCRGEGQVFLLSGEPGIGKSRLVSDLHDHILKGNSASAVVQCSAQYTNSALFPFIQLLESSTRVMSHDDEDSQRTKLPGYFASKFGVTAGDLLLEYVKEPEEEAANVDAGKKRRTFMHGLTNWLSGPGTNGPACIVFEDAHWSDPSSIDLLGQLVARTREFPLLVVVTTRPGFDAAWTTQYNATSLSLNRLDRSSSRKIVEAQFTDKPNTKVHPDDIVARAEGVPLFLEEFSRVARNMSDSTQIAEIPETLDGSLLTRLDELGPAKKLAQIGSVLGRQFPEYLLAKILQAETSEIQQHLSKLVKADVLARLGRADRAEYRFTHALVQDAAYASLLRRDRRHLHEKVADVLSALDDDRSFPNEVVASHLAAANRFHEASHRWLDAGRSEQRKSADREAIEHFRKALETRLCCPDSPDRDRLELEIVMALAPLILVVEGWSAAETSKIYARARELSQSLNEREPLLPICYGEYLIHVSRAEYGSAMKQAKELLELAVDLNDEAGTLQGHRVVAWCSLYLGNLTEAELHADQLLKIYRSDRHQSVAVKYGYDPCVAGLSILGIVSALKGRDEASAQFGREAVNHARSIDHASSLAYALMFACSMAAAMRSDRPEASRFGHELKKLAKDQESTLWDAYSDVILGWSGEEGAESIETAIDRLSSTARNPWRPFFQGLCAERYLETDQHEEAKKVLSEAIAAIDQTEERIWEAELCRLMARAVPNGFRGREDPTNYWLGRSIDVASRDGAVVLEKRSRHDLSNVEASSATR